MRPATWRDVTIDPDSGRIRLPKRFERAVLKPCSTSGSKSQVPSSKVRGHGASWRSVALDATGRMRRGAITIETDGALEIRLPHRLESPNALLHAHWRERHDDKQHWAAALAGAIDSTIGRGVLESLGFLHIRERRRLWIERRVSTARHFIRDRENLVYSAKFLVDRVRDCGLIRDDSMRWIDLEVSQVVSADGCDWTVIRIELPRDGVLQPPPPPRPPRKGRIS